jgi:hypothetical protein
VERRKLSDTKLKHLYPYVPHCLTSLVGHPKSATKKYNSRQHPPLPQKEVLIPISTPTRLTVSLPSSRTVIRMGVHLRVGMNPPELQPQTQYNRLVLDLLVQRYELQTAAGLQRLEKTVREHPNSDQHSVGTNKLQIQPASKEPKKIREKDREDSLGGAVQSEEESPFREGAPPDHGCRRSARPPASSSPRRILLLPIR